MRFGGIRRKFVDESLLSPKERERMRLRRLQESIIEELRLWAMKAWVLQSADRRYGLLVAALQCSRLSFTAQCADSLDASVHSCLRDEFTGEVVSAIEAAAEKLLGERVNLNLLFLEH